MAGESLPPPGLPPGGAGSSNTYPQWGFNQKGDVVEAHDSAQKLAYMEKGYLDWFTTEQAAHNAWQGQQGFFGSGNLPNPLSGIEEVGHVLDEFYHAITDVYMWRSLGWIVLGFAVFAVAVFLWLNHEGLIPKVP